MGKVLEGAATIALGIFGGGVSLYGAMSAKEYGQRKLRERRARKAEEAKKEKKSA